MHRRHIEMLGQTTITDSDLQGVVTTLHRLERFWMRGSDLQQQPLTEQALSPDSSRVFSESRR
jgi:hypothetical protein